MEILSNQTSASKEMSKHHPQHAQTLEEDLRWLKMCLDFRLATSADGSQSSTSPFHTPPYLNPELASQSTYISFVSEHKLNAEERLILLLALAPHLQPALLREVSPTPEARQSASLLLKTEYLFPKPSVETALFLLNPQGDMSTRLRLETYFDTTHLFYKKSILDIVATAQGEDYTERRLDLNMGIRDLFKHNEIRPPRFGPDFPANLLETHFDWGELFLSPHTGTQLEELMMRLALQKKFAQYEALNKHTAPGLRILFYGEPGTGKTLCATLMGKKLKQPVYRVDLSTVASKYIGESMQRLSSLFNMAEDKNWILFLDEGDALLHRRSENVNSETAHYANQDVAFLLQRIEKYKGIIIVATNHIKNMDPAFDRRFQCKVEFRKLLNEDYLIFFKQLWPKEYPLESEEKILKIISDTKKLCQADLINIAYACLTRVHLQQLTDLPIALFEKACKDLDYIKR